MFKKGDRVICIANDGWETELEVGEIFTVLDTEGNSIIVEVKNCGCKIKFASDRFELVEKLEPNQKSVFKTGDKVICIKADDSKSLIEGMKYTVYGVNNNCIFIMDGQGVFLTSYSKKLFKLAKEELKTTFADVKVGDRVYDIRYGWGTIIDSPFKRYPIAVNFDDGKAMDSYTLDGISEEKYLTPTLYWDVPTIITPPRKVVKKELKYMNCFYAANGVDICTTVYDTKSEAISESKRSGCKYLLTGHPVEIEVTPECSKATLYLNVSLKKKRYLHASLHENSDEAREVAGILERGDSSVKFLIVGYPVEVEK